MRNKKRRKQQILLMPKSQRKNHKINLQKNLGKNHKINLEITNRIQLGRQNRIRLVQIQVKHMITTKKIMNKRLSIDKMFEKVHMIMKKILQIIMERMSMITIRKQRGLRQFSQ